MNEIYYKVRDLKGATDGKKFLKSHYEELDDLDWNYLITNKILNIDLIDKYSEYVSWDLICMLYSLSEEFMEKHLFYLDWYAVSSFQKLSLDFIKKHLDELSVDKLSSNYKIIESEEGSKIKDYLSSIKFTMAMKKRSQENLKANRIFGRFKKFDNLEDEKKSNEAIIEKVSEEEQIIKPKRHRRTKAEMEEYRKSLENKKDSEDKSATILSKPKRHRRTKAEMEADKIKNKPIVESKPKRHRRTKAEMEEYRKSLETQTEDKDIKPKRHRRTKAEMEEYRKSLKEV